MDRPRATRASLTCGAAAPAAPASVSAWAPPSLASATFRSGTPEGAVAFAFIVEAADRTPRKIAPSASKPAANAAPLRHDADSRLHPTIARTVVPPRPLWPGCVFAKPAWLERGNLALARQTSQNDLLMKAAPPDWPRISSSATYEDAAKAIDWLCRAFGFEVRLKIDGEGGTIEHSELVFGEGLVMVSDARRAAQTGRGFRKSPRALGGANTQSMMVYVDDVEAHCKRAREAGAKIVSEPKTTDYGADYWADRGYEAEDPEGHRWSFYERLRNPPGK